jgi:hypothetical protein
VVKRSDQVPTRHRSPIAGFGRLSGAAAAAPDPIGSNDPASTNPAQTLIALITTGSFRLTTNH